MENQEYPEHCKSCPKLAECKQKVFMLADTEPVQGYVDIDASDYSCGSCIDLLTRNTIPMDNPELDAPAHCSNCGVPLECRLTTDGVEYIEELLAEGGGCCRELWATLFADYLKGV